MRRSTVSSLCALSLVAAGCGESNTHSAREVRAALAVRGIDAEVTGTAPPRELRAKVHASTLRIPLLLRYDGARLAGLAARKTPRRDVYGDGFSIFVAADPEDARYIRWLFSQRTYFPTGPRVRPYRLDNLVIVMATPRVDAVLRDLP